jgi:hypothetical protein
MRWTTRFKRWGGYLMVEAHRERQFERIAETIEQMPPHRQETLKRFGEWMSENPLRLMSQAVEDFFWPDVIDATYDEIVDLEPQTENPFP